MHNKPSYYNVMISLWQQTWLTSPNGLESWVTAVKEATVHVSKQASVDLP